MIASIVLVALVLGAWAQDECNCEEGFYCRPSFVDGRVSAECVEIPRCDPPCMDGQYCKISFSLGDGLTTECAERPTVPPEISLPDHDARPTCDPTCDAGFYCRPSRDDAGVVSASCVEIPSIFQIPSCDEPCQKGFFCKRSFSVDGGLVAECVERHAPDVSNSPLCDPECGDGFICKPSRDDAGVVTASCVEKPTGGSDRPVCPEDCQDGYVCKVSRGEDGVATAACAELPENNRPVCDPPCSDSERCKHSAKEDGEFTSECVGVGSASSGGRCSPACSEGFRCAGVECVPERRPQCSPECLHGAHCRWALSDDADAGYSAQCLAKESFLVRFPRGLSQRLPLLTAVISEILSRYCALPGVQCSGLDVHGMGRMWISQQHCAPDSQCSARINFGNRGGAFDSGRLVRLLKAALRGYGGTLEGLDAVQVVDDCLEDLDLTGEVDIADLADLLASWFCEDITCDALQLDPTRRVGITHLTHLLTRFGSSCVIDALKAEN